MIVTADELDWWVFMTLAGEEGWIIPHNELELHRQARCSRAWSYRHNGATIGLVTGLIHQKSAWIGNLIIAQELRGEGFGSLLFDHTVEELSHAGVETLWLTASEQGAPLYARRGFQTVGRIERWGLKGGGLGRSITSAITINGKDLDTEIWGDNRSSLLSYLEASGTWFQSGESLALLQRDDKVQIIGPWYGSSSVKDDVLLLRRLVSAASPQKDLVVDLLGSSGKQELLAAAGFTLNGQTTLMAAGPTKVEWSRLLALATLGSCG